jgi:hypothetical protein
VSSGPPYTIASTHIKGALIYKECMQAVEDINEFLRAMLFVSNRRLLRKYEYYL